MKQAEKALQTKLMLVDALKKKMAVKPISKITVRELIEDCDLNRKTFYYHFTDIYHLLKWMLEQEALEVVKSFDLLLNLEDAIEFVMKYVTENKHILNCALDGIGREDLKRFFAADFYDIIHFNIQRSQQELNIRITEDFEQFIALVYTEAIAGLLIEWIQAQHSGEDSYINAEYISLFLRESLHPVMLAAAAKTK